MLAGAAACAVAFGALLTLAYGFADARAVDAAALEGFLGVGGDRVTRLANALTDLGNPLPVALLAIALALIALARGRPRVAVFVLALVAVTSVSSQTLKAVLAYPRPEGTLGDTAISDAAFPSGHATAVMSLAIALVVTMPTRLRPAAAAVGLALVLAVSYSLVAIGGHFPSDVVGGFLLATGAALVLLAGLRTADARFPARQPRGRLARAAERWVERLAVVGLAAGIAAGVLVVGACVVIAVRRGPEIVDYAQAHTTFFVVAGVLAVSALVLLGALTSVLSRRT